MGIAIGFLLKQAGYTITAVSDQSPTAAADGQKLTGGRIFENFVDVVPEADTVFIATTDDSIGDVCKGIADARVIRPGQKFIHLSGTGSLDLLAPAKAAGAHVASIHPIQSFADVQGAIENIPGSTFGFTADEPIREWALSIISDLGGVPFYVPDSDKPLYHAAACIASNYLTALMNMVEEIYFSLGLSREEAIRAFWPLVRGTLKNIESYGTILALTGPIARGDTGTVEKHVSALHQKLPAFLDAYRAMGIVTVDLATKKGLSEDKSRAIRTVLEGEKP